MSDASVICQMYLLYATVYKVCPNSIQPSLVSWELVEQPLCNLSINQRQPYRACMNRHSPIWLLNWQLFWKLFGINNYFYLFSDAYYLKMWSSFYFFPSWESGWNCTQRRHSPTDSSFTRLLWHWCTLLLFWSHW